MKELPGEDTADYLINMLNVDNMCQIKKPKKKRFLPGVWYTAVFNPEIVFQKLALESLGHEPIN